MKATLGITSTHSECDRNGAIIGVQSHRTSERASATATSFGCWVFAERRMTPPDSPVICNSGLQNWFRTRHAFRPRQAADQGGLRSARPNTSLRRPLPTTDGGVELCLGQAQEMSFFK